MVYITCTRSTKAIHTDNRDRDRMTMPKNIRCFICLCTVNIIKELSSHAQSVNVSYTETKVLDWNLRPNFNLNGKSMVLD